MKQKRWMGLTLLLAAALFTAGCGTKEEAPQPIPSAQQTQVAAGEQEISLYFAAEDASCLVESRRTVAAADPTVEEQATDVIRELTAGPDPESGLFAVMPEGTELQSASFADGVLTVSLNRAFLDAQHGGSAGMMLTLYSVVDSLACLTGVDAVVIHIDGEAVEAYEGLIMPDEPIIPWENVATK